MLDALRTFDLAVFHAVNGWSGNWVLDRLANGEETFNLLRGGVLLAAYWWFWFAGSGERRHTNRRRLCAALLGVAAALIAARSLAMLLPFRTRPMYDPSSGFRPLSIPFNGNMEDWSAFPSDTATYFFALCAGLARLSPRTAAMLAAFSALWICLPRLYMGMHYPSDLITGTVIGVGIVWACTSAMEARGATRGEEVYARVSALEQRFPQAFYAVAFVLTFEMTTAFSTVRHLVRGTYHLLRHLST